MERGGLVGGAAPRLQKADVQSELCVLVIVTLTCNFASRVGRIAMSAMLMGVIPHTLIGSRRLLIEFIQVWVFTDLLFLWVEEWVLTEWVYEL